MPTVEHNLSALYYLVQAILAVALFFLLASLRWHRAVAPILELNGVAF